jgi:hypothetical protein
VTPEQKRMWDYLTNNYAQIAHEMGRELSLTNKRWFHRKANKFLSVINTWPIEDAARAASTWINRYHLPINPSKLQNFDAFHEKCGAWVISNTRNRQSIRPFELGE